MTHTEASIVVECDEVSGPATRGLACLSSSRGELRDQATKEQVVARLAREPGTAAQLAARIGVTAQGLYRHIRELQSAGLVREVQAPRGRPRHERYYRTAIPIVGRRDQDHMMAPVDALARAIVQAYEAHENALRQSFQGTQLAQEAWEYEDLALCVLDEAERMARAQLVARGKLPDTQGRVFWGREVSAGS